MNQTLQRVAENYVALNLAYLPQTRLTRAKETLTVAVTPNRTASTVDVAASADLGGTMFARHLPLAGNSTGPATTAVAAKVESLTVPIEVVLAIDTSGSMGRTLIGNSPWWDPDTNPTGHKTLAAEGRTASVVDLDPVSGRIPALLGVEPADGLPALLAALDTGAPADAEAGNIAERVDLVCTPADAELSVIAYAPAESLSPAPSATAVRTLLEHLANRTQVVLVTGFRDPDTSLDIMQRADARVLLCEPTLSSLVWRSAISRCSARNVRRPWFSVFRERRAARCRGPIFDTRSATVVPTSSFRSTARFMRRPPVARSGGPAAHTAGR